MRWQQVLTIDALKNVSVTAFRFPEHLYDESDSISDISDSVTMLAFRVSVIALLLTRCSLTRMLFSMSATNRNDPLTADSAARLLSRNTLREPDEEIQRVIAKIRQQSG